MDLNPSLIPRFNIDYDMVDLIGAIRNISKPVDTSATSGTIKVLSTMMYCMVSKEVSSTMLSFLFVIFLHCN